jgi:hypothetical protein
VAAEMVIAAPPLVSRLAVLMTLSVLLLVEDVAAVKDASLGMGRSSSMEAVILLFVFK